MPPHSPRRSSTHTQSDPEEFNAAEYLNKNEYNADIEDIRKRLDFLEGRVKDHASLATSFNEAFENDKAMDKVLVALLCELIKKDPDFKKAVGDAVRESDRNWFISRLKSIWGIVWAILLLLIGAIVEHLLNHGSAH